MCFLCDEIPPAPQGGIGSFVCDIGQELVRAGHAVTTVGLYEAPLGGAEDNLGGMRVIRLDKSGGRGRFAFLADRVRVARTVRRLWVDGSIDIVEAPESGAWSVFLPAKVPCVVRLHSSVRYAVANGRIGRRGRMLTLAENIAIRRSSSLVAVSQWVAAQAPRDYRGAGLARRTIEVIYNGVDLTLFVEQPWCDRVPGRIVFAGTVKAQKGILSLLKAFSLVCSKDPEASLVMAGRDTYVDGRSYFERCVREAALPPSLMRRVEYMGSVPRERLPSLYGSAAVCVFPSLGESFGLTAIEAMACMRPVVYTSTTAGPEVVDDGETGLLASPDDPDQIARQILRALSDDEYVNRLAGAGARQVRLRFSQEACARSSLELYCRLVGQPAGHNQ